MEPKSQTPLSQRSKNFMEKCTGRLYRKADVGDDCCKTVSSGDARVLTLMNSQQPWLSAQALYHIKSDNTLERLGERLAKLHP